MSFNLNLNSKLPCRNYIFYFDGRAWWCVASTDNDSVGMLFSDFMSLPGIEFSEDDNHLFCCAKDRKVKIRQFGFDIQFYFNPLNGILL